MQNDVARAVKSASAVEAAAPAGVHVGKLPAVRVVVEAEAPLTTRDRSTGSRIVGSNGARGLPDCLVHRPTKPGVTCSNHVGRAKPHQQSERRQRPTRGLSLAERLARFIDRSDPDGCHPWTGHRDKHGYGKITVGTKATGKTVRQAHVVAWEVATGQKVPVGMVLRHVKCGNPPCCRDDHLAPGTQAENCQDTFRMGRTTVGEKSGTAKLTDARVRLIFLRIQAGEPETTIAASEGVSAATVWQIAHGVSWTHVTGLPRRILPRSRSARPSSTGRAA